MGKSLVAAYDAGGLYVKDAMLLLPSDRRHSLKYFLGIINSRLMNYFYQEFFITIDVLKNALLSLPIRRIDFDDDDDKARHNIVVIKVDAMLAAQKALADARTDKDKDYYGSKCSGLDRQIDHLIYALYDLNEDEIKIVEGSKD